MALQLASASLSAAAAVTCATLSQRVLITPGKVQCVAPYPRGPVVPGPYVTVPGTSDGTYDA